MPASALNSDIPLIYKPQPLPGICPGSGAAFQSIHQVPLNAFDALGFALHNFSGSPHALLRKRLFY
jgi:hypothetical protein